MRNPVTATAACSLIACTSLLTPSAAAFTPASAGSHRAPVAAMSRAYVAGKYGIELDGVKVGFLKSISGGGISAEVINEPVGPGHLVMKHIGSPKFDDFTAQIGFGQGDRVLWDWIKSAWQMNYQRKNGAIVTVDQDYTEKSRIEFFNALITETTIPACDGASKDPAYMTLKFAPESTRYKKGSGSKFVVEGGNKTQKTWLPSNFRLEITGLDTSKVNHIDALTVKQGFTTDGVGDARDMAKEPGKLEFPALKFTFPETYAQPWLDYFEDFVIKGNSTADKEKTGSLTLLSANRQEELLKIDFFNMGIYKIRGEDHEANDDQIPRMRAELYLERMELVLPGQKVGRLPRDPRS